MAGPPGLHSYRNGKGSSGSHHAAMNYAEIPAFIASLRERETTHTLALEFLILTAARVGEVLGAQWSEIDIALRTSIIPASRMKASREHRIPLSGRALAIVERMAELRSGDFVFPGQRRGRPLSNPSLARSSEKSRPFFVRQLLVDQSARLAREKYVPTST